MIPWIIAGVCVVLMLLAVACALTYYRELWKWARMCQESRLVIAHKNRVRMNYTFLQFIEWCNSLEKDKGTRGQMIYSMAGTSVSIVKRMTKDDKRNAVKAAREARKSGSSAPRMRQGTWSATDETVKS